MRRVFINRLRGRLAFRHRRNFIRPVYRLAPIPRALINNFAVNLFPARHLLFRIHEREHGARNHRHIRPADNLEQPQRVQHLFIAPGIAGKHGNAENIRLRRVQNRQHGLHIRPAGPSAVLIDDHLALRLRRGGRREERRERRGKKHSDRQAAQRRELRGQNNPASYFHFHLKGLSEGDSDTPVDIQYIIVRVKWCGQKVV